MDMCQFTTLSTTGAVSATYWGVTSSFPEGIHAASKAGSPSKPMSGDLSSPIGTMMLFAFHSAQFPSFQHSSVIPYCRFIYS